MTGMAIYLRGNSYYYDFVYKGQRLHGLHRPGVPDHGQGGGEARKKTEVIEGRLNPAKARKSPRFDTFAETYLEWSKDNKKPLTTLRNRKALDNLTACFGQRS